MFRGSTVVTGIYTKPIKYVDDGVCQETGGGGLISGNLEQANKRSTR